MLGSSRALQHLLLFQRLFSFGAIQGELHNICDALPVHIGMCHVPAPMIAALDPGGIFKWMLGVAELAGFLDSI